ncbi:polysaccharide pyruvyl transferase-domain-containing protein [Geopyxis carbonaria]|nr:polysaccharide pyruvyl transferase-domain-containing protein [Geopyxis carbonaria]
MLTTKRLTPVLFAVFLLLAFLFFFDTPSAGQGYITAAPDVPAAKGGAAVAPPKPAPPKSKFAGAVSYDKTTPPNTGCEEIVHKAQQKIIETYQEQLKGVRYANIWGYLETENKGDAAIWSAQQILLSMMGITFMEACRFLDKGCDVDKFKGALEAHKDHAAIIIAGGGNFNDFYWEDQPSRIKMVETFTQFPIRSFPQSIHMTNPERIERTKKAFGAHANLQLAARDQPSFDWLDTTFGKKAQASEMVTPEKVKTILTPDIAFMWGSRPDFRIKTKKTHQVLILSRDDWEISEGDSRNIPFGEGSLDLGGTVGNVTYYKVDWKKTQTPDIDAVETTAPDGTKSTTGAKEPGKNQRAWAKAVEGFRMLGTADFIITDRLHGHIMSTLIGTPHVLMDSKLKKNLNYHDTWTKDCGCTRVADNIDEAKEFARMFFEQKVHTVGGDF